MNLDTFTPPVREEGDRVPAKEMVGRPLVVLVREHRTGVKTQFNSNPQDPAKYRPEGGEAVLLDMADLTTGAVYIGALWFNGAIVDSLKGYVAQALPVKLFYDTPKTGTNPYLNVEPLAGNELAAAHQWVTANPDRFERERAARQAAALAAASVPSAPMSAPVGTRGPIAQIPAQVVHQFAPLGAAAASAPATPYIPTPPVAPAAPPTVDVTDPAIQALLAQIASQQQR